MKLLQLVSLAALVNAQEEAPEQWIEIMEAVQSATMYQDTYSNMFGAQNILGRTVDKNSAEDSWLSDDNNACINTLTSSNTESWWTGRFKGQWDVNRIRILPDRLFGSSLAEAKVYIGNTLCATLHESIGDINVGSWWNVDCVDGVDEEGNPIPVSVKGKNIRIQKDAALLVFCGLQVYGVNTAPDPNSLLWELQEATNTAAHMAQRIDFNSNEGPEQTEILEAQKEELEGEIATLEETLGGLLEQKDASCQRTKVPVSFDQNCGPQTAWSWSTWSMVDTGKHLCWNGRFWRGIAQ